MSPAFPGNDAAGMTMVMPGLDIARGGVAAYGHQLAGLLSDRVGPVDFVVADPSGTAPAGAGEFAVRLTPRESAALARVLDGRGTARVLLHYVGYGYAPDACPAWLLGGLAQWKAAKPGRRLDIFFHELATEEPWWTRTFWTQPQQRRIVRGLARLADAVATSCPHFSGQLTGCLGIESSHVAVVPVPPTLATAGAQKPKPPKTRALTALVFGLRGTRARTLRLHGALLRHLAREGILGGLVIAGDKARVEEARGLRGVPLEIVARPNVDAAQLALLANEMDFGLVWNWPPILTKSTVFANLCALGVPAVATRKNRNVNTGLAVEPAAIVCDGSPREIEQAGRAIADPALRATLRTNAAELAGTSLSWASAVAKLERHFGL